MKSYEISEDNQSITCRICGMTSHNHHDVIARYCGNCHIFHSESDWKPKPMKSKRRQFIECILLGASWGWLYGRVILYLPPTPRMFAQLMVSFVVIAVMICAMRELRKSRKDMNAATEAIDRHRKMMEELLSSTEPPSSPPAVH